MTIAQRVAGLEMQVLSIVVEIDGADGYRYVPTDDRHLPGCVITGMMYEPNSRLRQAGWQPGQVAIISVWSSTKAADNELARLARELRLGRPPQPLTTLRLAGPG